MRRIFSITCLLALLAAGIVFASGNSEAGGSHVKLSPETLNYKVMFKWGLINKRAGTATLTLNKSPKEYHSMLAAHSEPWADRIYKVRDTLIGRMSLENFKPLYYEKIAHESNEFKHDVVKYDYTGYPPLTAADCIRKVVKKGELIRDETRRLESENKTVDMLTSFYYMRTLPFHDWLPGHTDETDIFSGKQKERLSIVYHGETDIIIDNKKHRAYHITFKFTSKGGKKSSDDMEAWISTDSARIPLKMEGKLPIGKVHCIYIGE